MNPLLDIPELVGLDSRRGLIRIPPELDVPLTDRVRRIIDTAEFRRLARISQLGLVALVYPAALHTRFEHSLGVYRLALLLLKQLAHDPRFAAAVRPEDAELLIVTALVHDLGHWPFCHAIEDMHLAGVPDHELFARRFLTEGAIAGVLREHWGIDPGDVAALLSGRPADEGSPRSRAWQVFASMLSGPIDIDKMDYLFRDSLHAGVPYGRHFDQQRLIGSLTLNAAGDGLAVTDKGKTAAELMVFARYVMFSEVYWHHGVRSATAMFQRAFSSLSDRLDLNALFCKTESEMIAELRTAAATSSRSAVGAAELLEGLFGPVRTLYKRLTQYSLFEQPELYHRLARRPYPWLAACAERFAEAAAERLGQPIAAHEILFDAPPVHREVQFKVDIHFTKEGCYRWLGQVSPVVRALALEQFDDYVKRVRIFVHPRIAAPLRALDDVPELVAAAVDQTP